MSERIKEEFFPEYGSVFFFKNQFHFFSGSPEELPERPREPAVYINNFYLSDSKPWKRYPHHTLLSSDDLVENLNRLSRKGTSSISIFSQEAKTQFFKQFQAVQEQFKEGSCQKIVAYCFHKVASSASGASLLISILRFQANQPQEGFYCHWAGDDFLVGVSPEVLIEQIKKEEVSTMALAGTVALQVFENQPQTLLEDEKERFEHELVAKSMEAILSKLGSFKRSPIGIRKTQKLVHLQTLFSGELHTSKTLDAVIKALHPTPALGCSPRLDWENLMKAVDVNFSERGFFGAPVGLSLNSEVCEIRVAIRGLQEKNGACILGTGCGVVEQSVFEKEWDELLNKKNATLEGLGF